MPLRRILFLIQVLCLCNVPQLCGIRTGTRELRFTTTERCGSLTAFRFVEETGSHVGFELHVKKSEPLSNVNE